MADSEHERPRRDLPRKTAPLDLGFHRGIGARCHAGGRRGRCLFSYLRLANFYRARSPLYCWVNIRVAGDHSK